MPIGSPQPIWYQTTPGRIFVGILAVLLVSVGGFATLMGYYLWQIHTGDATELELSFRKEGLTFSKELSQTPQTSELGLSADKIVRPQDPSFGEGSEVTIVAFTDTGCHFSKLGWPVFNEVIHNFSPAVKVVFKNLNLQSSGNLSGQAVLCAGEQGKFVEYYSRLFEDGGVDESSLVAYANQIGLDTSLFAGCLRADRHQATFGQNLEDARTFGVRGTPTFIVNNKKIEGVKTADEWAQIILTELSAQ